MTSIVTVLLLTISISTVTSKPTSFTDDDVLYQIYAACNISQLYCPKEQFEHSSKDVKLWDESKLMESMKYKLFKTGAVSKDEAKGYLKDAFCCDDYPCFNGCRWYPVEEKKIIQKLYKNYEKIFQLGFPELEEYKPFYEKFLDDVRTGAQHGLRPAEIEELYDLLHKNEAKYLKALAERGEKNLY